MKKANTTLRNQNLFCMNCGGSQTVPYPLPIDMMTAMMKSFNKLHNNCEKTWSEPTPDIKTNIETRMRLWLSQGERGVSSETIFSVLSGERIRQGYSHPLDPSDFYRCYKLLKFIPEWKGKLSLMKPISSEWEKLVDNWDKLTEMLEEQIKTDKSNGMYEFMKTLGC